MILRKVPPAGFVTLPVSLDAAKMHLRVDFAHEDTLITQLIETARDHVETVLGRSLINRQWTASRDCFPSCSNRLEIPVAPLQSVQSVTYYDAAGASQTLNSNKYSVIKDDTTPGWIELLPDETWPDTQQRSDAVAVTFTSGYGATDATVPAAARHAMLLLIGHWYSNREATATDSLPKQIELGVDTLLRTLHTGYIAGSWDA